MKKTMYWTEGGRGDTTHVLETIIPRILFHMQQIKGWQESKICHERDFERKWKPEWWTQEGFSMNFGLVKGKWLI